MSMYSLLLKILMTQAIRRSAVLILYGIPFQTKSKWIQISEFWRIANCYSAETLMKSKLFVIHARSYKRIFWCNKIERSVPLVRLLKPKKRSSEKRRATVVATRLECKQLEDKIKNLQNKIEECCEYQ